MRLGRALWWFWCQRGYWTEGRERLARVLAMPGAAERSIARAILLRQAGQLAFAQGDLPAARAVLEDSLAILQERQDMDRLASVLNALGEVAHLQGDHEAARSLFTQSLELLRRLGDRSGIPWALQALGEVACGQGDDSAEAITRESLRLFQELAEQGGIALCLSCLGEIARTRGDLSSAHSFHQQSLSLRRELGSKGGVARSLGDLGAVATAEGDDEAAHSLYQECLVLRRELGARSGLASCLEGLAGLARAQGQPERAARLLGAAHALRDAVGIPIPAVDRGSYEQSVAAVRAALDETTFAAAWAEGRSMSLDQATATALDGYVVCATVDAVGTLQGEEVTPGQETYCYQMTAGGRVVLVAGTAGGGHEIDSGLIQTDFFPDRLSALLRRVHEQSSRQPDRWVQELFEALPPSHVKALLLARLGERAAARALLGSLLTTEDRVERVQAALALAQLDCGQSAVAVATLRPLLTEPDLTGGYLLPQVARALIHLEPAQSVTVVPILQNLIEQNGNNFVRIPAMGALVAADPEQVPAAIRWLEPLLQDPNNEIRLKAVRLLWELDASYTELALQIARPLLWDPNGDVRRAVFDLLVAIGTHRPATIGSLSWPWEYLAYRLAAADTTRALRDFALADDLAALRHAAGRVEDFSVRQRRDVDDFTQAIAIKHASVLRGRTQAGTGESEGVTYLLDEMRSRRADQWAIYRHGCALAIRLCTVPEQRAPVAARLERLWEAEAQPHLRIALALARDQLREGAPS